MREEGGGREREWQNWWSECGNGFGIECEGLADCILQCSCATAACDLLSNNFSYPTFPQNNESEIDLPRYQISLEPLKHHLLTSTYLCRYAHTKIYEYGII